MGFYSKKPSLTYREVADQIFKRSGIPLEMIKTVMDLYAEVTEEALLGNVEVPFGRIGFFSWKQIMPKADVTVWNPKERRFDEHRDFPGYQKTMFRVSKNWTETLKEASAFGPGEENPMLFGTPETAVYEDDKEMENDEIEEDSDGE